MFIRRFSPLGDGQKSGTHRSGTLLISNGHCSSYILYDVKYVFETLLCGITCCMWSTNNVLCSVTCDFGMLL